MGKNKTIIPESNHGNVTSQQTTTTKQKQQTYSKHDDGDNLVCNRLNPPAHGHGGPHLRVDSKPKQLCSRTPETTDRRGPAAPEVKVPTNS